MGWTPNLAGRAERPPALTVSIAKWTKHTLFLFGESDYHLNLAVSFQYSSSIINQKIFTYHAVYIFIYQIFL